MLLTEAHKAFWAAFYGWQGWAAVGVLSAAIIGLLLIWFAARPFFQKQRLYWICKITPLAKAGRSFGDRLSISWDSEKLDRPQIVAITLVSRSAKDIPPEAFAGSEPLVIGLGIPVKALLGPEQRGPAIGAMGKEIHVLPRLIRRRQVINLEALVDGDPLVTVDDQLTNVKVAQRDGVASLLGSHADKYVDIVALGAGVAWLTAILSRPWH